MKEFIVFPFVFLLPFLGFSQPNTTDVPIIVEWNVGDSFNYKVQKINKLWHYDMIVTNDSIEYVTQIQIVDFHDSKFIIKWSNNCFLEEYANVDEIKIKFNQIKNKEILYSVSERGVFIGIENWEEWTSVITEIYNGIFDYFTRENGGITPDFILEAERSMGDFFRSKEGLELMIFDELALFHYALGLELSETDTLKFVEKVSSPVLDKPIKADALLFYDSVDLMNNLCIVNYEASLNPLAAQEFISELFNQKEQLVSHRDPDSKEKAVVLNQSIKCISKCSPALPWRVHYQKDFRLELGKERASGLERIMIERLKD